MSDGDGLDRPGFYSNLQKTAGLSGGVTEIDKKINKLIQKSE